MEQKTLLDTLLTESKLPPISLELDTKSIVRLSAALFLVAVLVIMFAAAVNKK